MTTLYYIEEGIYYTQESRFMDSETNNIFIKLVRAHTATAHISIKSENPNEVEPYQEV